MKKGLIATILIITISFSFGAVLYIKTPLGDMVSQLIGQWIGGSEDDEPTSYDDIVASDYISIQNYKTHSVNLDDFYDYRQPVFETEIAKILNTYKPKDVYVNNDVNYDPKITEGDTVELYYRGFFLNEDGTRDYMDGMSNIGNSVPQKPYGLTVGGSSFIAGFEIGLLDKNLSDYPSLEFIKEGEINDNLMVFISYQRRLIEDGDSYGPTEASTAKLTDLSLGSEAIDNMYGEGFYDFLLYGESRDIYGDTYYAPRRIGENLINYYNNPQRFDLNGLEYEYTRIKIEYAMENYDYPDDLLLEVRFPHNYGISDISCRDSWFEIYVQGITEYYDDSEGDVIFNDEFLLKNDSEALKGLARQYIKNKPINPSKRYPEIADETEACVQYMLDDLQEKYPHFTTVSERYSQYLWDKITEEYEYQKTLKVREYVFNHLIENTTIKKYPEKILEATKNEILSQLQKAYKEFLKSYADSSWIEDYSFEQYCKERCYIGKNDDSVEDAIDRMAKEHVLKNLVASYIADKEKLDFSESNLNEAFCDMITEDPDDSYVITYFANHPEESSKDYDGQEEELLLKVCEYAKVDLYESFIPSYYIYEYSYKGTFESDALVYIAAKALVDKYVSVVTILE